MDVAFWVANGDDEVLARAVSLRLNRMTIMRLVRSLRIVGIIGVLSSLLMYNIFSVKLIV